MPRATAARTPPAFELRGLGQMALKLEVANSTMPAVAGERQLSHRSHGDLTGKHLVALTAAPTTPAIFSAMRCPRWAFVDCANVPSERRPARSGCAARWHQSRPGVSR